MTKVLLQVTQSLSIRQSKEQKAQRQQSRWDNRGVVIGANSKGYQVRTDLGNIVYVRPENVNTNGNIVGQKVVVFKPRFGQAFLDGKVSG